MLKRMILAAMLCVPFFGVSVAPAAEVNFGLELNDVTGAKAMVPPDNKVALTVGKACAIALLTSYQDDASVSTDEKLRRYKLATKLYDSNQSMELSDNERELCKKYVARAWSPYIIGMMFGLLDPPSLNIK